MKRAIFTKFHIYDYDLGREIMSVDYIWADEEWSSPITGEPHRIQWRIWFKNVGDETVRVTLNTDISYLQRWGRGAEYSPKWRPFRVTLEPGEEANFFADDYLPDARYWEYEGIDFRLLVDGELSDEIFTLIDNGLKLILCHCYRPAVPVGWDVAVSVKISIDGQVRSAGEGEVMVSISKSGYVSDEVPTDANGVAIFTHSEYSWLVGDADGERYTITAYLTSDPSIRKSIDIILKERSWEVAG